MQDRGDPEQRPPCSSVSRSSAASRWPGPRRPGKPSRGASTAGWSYPGWAPSWSPPGRWHLDLTTADLDAAEPIAARSARSVGIAVVDACTTQGRPGPSPCRQVRRGGGRQGAAVGATLGQERRSPPTEQRFRSVERPTVNTAASARKGQDQSNAEPRESSWSPTATPAQPGRSWPVAGSSPSQRGTPRRGGHHAG